MSEGEASWDRVRAGVRPTTSAAVDLGASGVRVGTAGWGTAKASFYRAHARAYRQKLAKDDATSRTLSSGVRSEECQTPLDFHTAEPEPVAALDPMGLYSAEGEGVRVVMHGQDGQALLQDGDVLMILAADGHSDKLGGVAYSKYALWLLPNRVLAIMPKIRELVKKGEDGAEQLRRLMKDTFFALDVFLRNDCPYTKEYKSGGATLTLNVKFPHPTEAGKCCSLTSNVGDSPMVLVDPVNRKCPQMTLELNCDSGLEAYQLYVDDCIEAGVQPKEAWLGRYNSALGYKAPWVRDASGNLTHVRIYNLVDDDKGHPVAVHNEEGLRQFYTGATPAFREYLKQGGPQSLRGQMDNRAMQAQGKFPSCNHGNTLQYMGQNLSSFGDWEHKRSGYNTVFPVYTHLEVYSERRIEIIGSDGFFDLLTDDALLECIDEVSKGEGGGGGDGPNGAAALPTAEAYLDELLKKLIHVATTQRIDSSNPKSSLMFPMTQGKIDWDDVCAWVVITDFTK